MAGTDRTRARVEEDGPQITLVGPQLGENIGASARAMLNCGLTNMVLVSPREPWPNEKAAKMSSGASEVLDRARLFDGIGAAVGGLNHVYAATTRTRDKTQRVVTPRRAAEEMRRAMAAGEPVGILFGPERSGLTNEDLQHADTVISVPLNPSYTSLNLAQAVLIIGYEWFHAGAAVEPEVLLMHATRPANKEELGFFLARLERELDAAGFFHVEDMRPTMVRNLRTIFQRANLTEQDVRTLHGVVAALVRQRSR